ncbi:hypothetical protein GGF41_000882, partial [Coemansia sp. RSA 2531]
YLAIVAILSELSLRVLKRYKKPHVLAPTVAVSLPVAVSKPPPLTFQILQMLIVYKTVEYLECRSKYSIGLDMDKHNKSKAVLTPLLSVSERWRRAALESICDNCALDFDHSHEAREIVFPAWPADFKLAQLRKSNMAK